MGCVSLIAQLAESHCQDLTAGSSSLAGGSLKRSVAVFVFSCPRIPGKLSEVSDVGLEVTRGNMRAFLRSRCCARNRLSYWSCSKQVGAHRGRPLAILVLGATVDEPRYRADMTTAPENLNYTSPCSSSWSVGSNTVQLNVPFAQLDSLCPLNRSSTATSLYRRGWLTLFVIATGPQSSESVAKEWHWPLTLEVPRQAPMVEKEWLPDQNSEKGG